MRDQTLPFQPGQGPSHRGAGIQSEQEYSSNQYCLHNTVQLNYDFTLKPEPVYGQPDPR
jgi:hypothetical protein